MLLKLQKVLGQLEAYLYRCRLVLFFSSLTCYSHALPPASRALLKTSGDPPPAFATEPIIKVPHYSTTQLPQAPCIMLIPVSVFLKDMKVYAVTINS